MNRFNPLLCVTVACAAVHLTAPRAFSGCGPDSDGDGICDFRDLCPGTIPGVSIDADGCPPAAPGDFDGDGDVDLADFNAAAECWLGPNLPSDASSVCQEADLDFDLDFDLQDFGAFERCFSGADLPADPDCVSHTAAIDGGCLRIVGTGASTQLALRLQPGAPSILLVDVGDDGIAEFGFNRTQFFCITIFARGGNDVVWIDETNGSISATEITTMDGGSGHDILIGGSGPETFFGGDGNDFVDGNQESDVVFLGADDDTFRWDPGDGNDVVEGQGGYDTLLLNGSGGNEIFGLSANGERFRLTRNVGNIVMDCNAVEQVDLNALGGADSITVTPLVGTDVVEVTIDLASPAGSGLGDAQADIVVFNGTDQPEAFGISGDAGAAEVSGLGALVRVEAGESLNDRLVVAGVGGDTVNVNGSAGPDTLEVLPSGTVGAAFVTCSTFSIPVDVGGVTLLALNGMDDADTIVGTGNVAALGIPLQFDGGNGNDTLRGSNAGELLLGGQGNDLVDGNQGNDIALLGGDDDVFQWDPGDGSDTVEGQNGHDTLLFNGSGASEVYDLSANGARLRLTRNIGNIVMDCDDVERVDLNVLGGADAVTVNNLSSTHVLEVNIDLAGVLGGVAGDAQPDVVTVNGTAGPEAFSIAGAGGAAEVRGPGALVRVEVGESLNDRLVIAGVGGDTVNVNGSTGPDTLEVLPSSTVGAAFVTCSTFSIPVDVSGVTLLALNGMDDADTIVGTGNLAALGIPLQFDGGDGNDTLRGGNANERLLGGPGDDFVDGNQGNDIALLGGDNDTFQWDPGDGSDVVEGQSGHDTLLFNGSGASEIFEFSANGLRLRLTRNVGNIVMDCNDVEQVDLNALGGADTGTVNSLAGTDVSAVNIRLAGILGGAVGDGQADAVVLNATSDADVVLVAADAGIVSVSGLAAQVTISTSEAAFDLLTVNLLAGDDTLDASGLAAGFIRFTADGGDHDDVITGSDGDDILLGGNGDDVLIGGPGVDVLDGGSGTNIVIQ